MIASLYSSEQQHTKKLFDFIEFCIFTDPTTIPAHQRLYSFLFMAIDKDRSRRFGEPAKFVPVIFVIGVIATVYGIYTYVCTVVLFRATVIHRHTFSDYCKSMWLKVDAMQASIRWGSSRLSFSMFSCSWLLYASFCP